MTTSEQPSPENNGHPPTRQETATVVSGRTKGIQNEVIVALCAAGFGVSLHLFAHAVYPLAKAITLLPPMITGILCYGGFALAAFVANQRRQRHRLPHGGSSTTTESRSHHQSEFILPALGVCGAIGMLWMAFGLEKSLLNRLSSLSISPYWITGGLSLVGMVISLVVAHRKTNIFSHLEVHPVAMSPRPVLLFPVSSENFRTGEPRLQSSSPTPSNAPTWYLDSPENVIYSQDLDTLPTLERLDKVIDKIGKIPAPWPWQQILRGLRPHLVDDAQGNPTLQHIFLIGSPGEKGSFQALPRLRRFLLAVLGDTITIRIGSPKIHDTALVTDEQARKLMNEEDAGVDFEDFTKLVPFLEQTLHRISSRFDIAYDQIMIDATGGQKPTSIAAAAITLKSQVRFQYVRTGSGDVLPFDIGLRESGH